MPFNALMPGEHDWMKQASPVGGGFIRPSTPQMPEPMQSQARGSNMAERKRGPVMNALAGLFEFGAPEAYEAGRQKKIGRELGRMMAGGDYEGAAAYALNAGNLDQGERLRGIAGQQAQAQQAQQAEARKLEAQQTLQVFQNMQPAQIVEFAHLDPVGFERSTGMAAEEYLSAAQRMMQAGMQPEQFHQYVIQKAQAELGQGGEAFTLAPGAQRYGPDGKLLANNPVAEKPQERWTPIEAPEGMGGYWERNDLTGQTRRVAAPPSGGIRVGTDENGNPVVQIGGPLDGVGYGSAPKGKESAIAFGADGQPVVTPGPQQAALNKAQNFLKSKTRTIGLVRDDIRRALELTSNPWATGVAAAATKDLPLVGSVTPAGRLERRINTIKANIGFDKLDEMRQNSPTGGALGNVTEKEIYFLQAILGDLDAVQTEEDLEYVLKRIDDFYADIQQQYEDAFAADYPSLAATAERRAGANQQANDLNGLYAPDGDPVTEEDIQETMKKHGLSREAVIARLRGQ